MISYLVYRIFDSRCFVEDENDPEKDRFTLEYDIGWPSTSQHRCVVTGVDQEVNNFHYELITSVRSDPVQHIHNLYFKTRTKYTGKLNKDEKILFLGKTYKIYDHKIFIQIFLLIDYKFKAT